MSYKQKAFKIAEQFGAVFEGTERDTMFQYSTLDFRTPAGVRWTANGQHASMQREDTLTECWKDFIVFASEGVEPCDCGCLPESCLTCAEGAECALCYESVGVCADCCTCED